jgi:RNA polymerase sigma factor (sigma-70 family)
LEAVVELEACLVVTASIPRVAAVVARDPLADPEPLMRRLYSYVAFHVGTGPDAEDIVSDTLERALRYRASYDPRRGEPLSWLIGIARHRISSRASDPPVAPLDRSDAVSVTDVEREAVERVALSAAVARLETRDRELVALHYGADLTPKQIAALLGLKQNAVEVALHRMRVRLRALLDESETSVPKDPARL